MTRSGRKSDSSFEGKHVQPPYSPSHGLSPDALGMQSWDISEDSPSPDGLEDPFEYHLRPTPQPQPQQRRRRRSQRRSIPGTGFLKSWQFWAVSGVIVSTSVAGFAAALLFRLPGLPNCPAIFWPTASASLRLYCAQVAADKQTIEDLLTAIALVQDLPPDHPLRSEIDQYLELWSVDILNLAEDSFQAGDLQKAIDTARKIPAQVSSADQVTERIDRWQSIWSEAESIYKKAENELRQQNFRQAFTLAVQLTDVDNEYWATTQYQKLSDQITSARRDGGKLDQARAKARQGGVENLLAAIKIAKEIPKTSYVYGEAQKAVREFIDEMYNLAIDTLDRGYSSDAIAIAKQIPTEGSMQKKVDDFLILAQAVAQAGQGDRPSLENAIQQVRQLASDSPLYGKAQQLISRWELEVQDVTRLNWARQLAGPGTIGDLSAAIAEARLIPSTNPRGDEAQAAIRQWTRQIQVMEDRPYLDQAERIAAPGDVLSLQRAITEAQNIRSGRPLYDEARERIQEWTRRVERTQDQPILNEARALANSGNLTGAIATAEQIRSGRTLYDEAQTDVKRWRDQIQGQRYLQDAYRSANFGNVSGLAEAIRIAAQVPSGSSARSEANRMRDTWSQELLRQANTAANYSLREAIAIAEQIPSGTSAYESAQMRLRDWDAQLAPPPAPAPTSTPDGLAEPPSPPPISP